MVRFTTALVACIALAPVSAMADDSLDDPMEVTHPGLTELLDGAEAPAEATAEQEQSIQLDVLPADGYEPADFAAYRQKHGGGCPGCSAEGVEPTYFYDPAFLRRMGYRWYDKRRVGLAFSAGPFSYGFWGDVREVYGLSNQESGLVPTLSSVSATQFDVVASELVIRAPAQDTSTGGSSSVSEPEPTASTPVSIDATVPGGSNSTVSNNSVSGGSSGISASNSGASLSKVSDVAALDRVSVSDTKVSAPLSRSIAADTVSVAPKASFAAKPSPVSTATQEQIFAPTPAPVQERVAFVSTPVVSNSSNNAVAPAPTSASGGEELAPSFSPSDDLGRSGSGADTSYTEYIGGFFIAAPF